MGLFSKRSATLFVLRSDGPKILLRLHSMHSERLKAEDFSSVNGISVRMAIHTGTADERDGDYFGPAVNRVARLLSIGNGGQILVSGASRELVRSDSPADVALTDLGLHRLKDLAEPEHVWQLSGAGLQQEFPALRSLDASPNNLPIHLTTFRGRERDLEEVKSLIGEHRLLTLSGAGGIGKTRLPCKSPPTSLDEYPRWRVVRRSGSNHRSRACRKLDRQSGGHHPNSGDAKLRRLSRSG